MGRKELSIRMLGVKLTLQWQRGKTQLGLILAVAALISCGLLYSWPVGLIFAAVYGFLGFFKLETASSWGSWGVVILWSMAIMLMLCVTGPLMVRAFGLLQMGILKVLLNLACCCIICCLLTAVTGRIRSSVTVTAVVMQLFATVNAYVYMFRSRELAILDIFSASTAMGVVDQYVFKISPEILCSWLLWGVGMFAGLCISTVPPRKTWHIRIGAVCTGVMLGVLLNFGSNGIDPLAWGRDGSRYNGLFLNFYLGIKNSGVEKPEGYSSQALEPWEQQYDLQAESKRQPNILVIMNEAYADFGVFPEKPQTNIPVTPFLDSLQDNVVRGYALASVYGGNTASSEFEFLTGHSMAYLPESAVPYQQYVRQEIYSLPWYLRSQGYTCVATHSYFAQGWARDVTYPRLGFSESTFVEDYPCQDLVRSYVSDREQYSYMLDLLQNREADAPLFLFGVTMQNHGGYTYTGANYTQTVHLQGYDAAYPQAEQYFTLLNQSDQALEDFLTALEDYPEDTVVLIFGDHFPKIEDAFYEEINGGPLDTLNERMLRYQVPFVIWANYELESEKIPCTSLNYLAGHLLDAAGVAKPAYFQFLSELESKVPAMNTLGYYCLEQQCFLPNSEPSPAEELLLRYAYLQYNNLIDGENRNHFFFGQYLP